MAAEVGAQDGAVKTFSMWDPEAICPGHCSPPSPLLLLLCVFIDF